MSTYNSISLYIISDAVCVDEDMEMEIDEGLHIQMYSSLSIVIRKVQLMYSSQSLNPTTYIVRIELLAEIISDLGNGLPPVAGTTGSTGKSGNRKCTNVYKCHMKTWALTNGNARVTTSSFLTLSDAWAK